MNHQIPIHQLTQHTNILQNNLTNPIDFSSQLVHLNHTQIPVKVLKKPETNNSNADKNECDLNKEVHEQLGLKSNQQIREQVKKWEKQRKQMESRRDQHLQKLKNKFQFEDKRVTQQKENKKLDHQKLKKQKVQKGIQQIQRRSKSRSQFLSQTKSTRINEPLFVQKQKQFLHKKIKQQENMRKMIVKKKQQMLKEMEQLSNHQMNFMNRLRERKKDTNKQRRYDNESGFNTSSKVSRAKSEFNLHLKKGEHFQKQFQKVARRKQFQRKLMKNIISIDLHKAKQVLIAKDRALNPQKYHYLSSASALTHEKIYDEFKQFQLKTDRKKIGNEYLRQVLTNRPKASRIGSVSESHLSNEARIDYKNYIPEVKALLKKQANKVARNEAQEIIFKYDNNSERLENLNKRSNFYQNEAVRRIKEMRSNENDGYSDHLIKQKIIDDFYTKSIKMKIASAQFIS